MSIARLMLRALAINALMTQPDDADDITMAGAYVFDSMLDPLQFDKSRKDIPAIIVYTDDDDGKLQTVSANTGPFVRDVDLRIEIVLASFDEIIKDDKLYISYGLPMTDSQLEAKLDLFEQQVRWALLAWPARAATNAFRAFVVRTWTITSHIHRDEQANNRMAMRVIHIKCQINDDYAPAWGFDIDPPTPTRDVEASDLALPDWLKPMLITAQNAKSMRVVIDALGGVNQPPVLLPILKRIGVNVDCISPADPTLLTRMGKDEGPDGRIELQALWQINPRPLPPPLGTPVTDPNFEAPRNETESSL